MARLDRLAPVKEIAQIGAAIGREFSCRLLEAVSPIQGAALQDALRQLMASELDPHARGGAIGCDAFLKHALVQDTAYRALLRSHAVNAIHADIARALVERFSDQIDAAPAVIARHYTEAGLAEQATRYWLKAAELALSRFAPVEAENYVDAGLALVAAPAANGWVRTANSSPNCRSGSPAPTRRIAGGRASPRRKQVAAA